MIYLVSMNLLLVLHFYLLRTLVNIINCFCIFMNTKNMWDARTIIFAAVSRRDLCYASENEGFHFPPNTNIQNGILHTLVEKVPTPCDIIFRLFRVAHLNFGEKQRGEKQRDQKWMCVFSLVFYINSQ